MIKQIKTHMISFWIILLAWQWWILWKTKQSILKKSKYVYLLSFHFWAHQTLWSKFLRRSLIFIMKGFGIIISIFIVISTTFLPRCPPPFFRFFVDYRVRQTPEGWRTYRSKCGNNNKDEDNSPKTLNDTNFVGCSMQKHCCQRIVVWIKRCNTFTNGNSLKVNVIVQLYFELVHYDVRVLDISQYATETLSVFANGPGILGSIPGRVIPKTQRMVLDASLLNTQHYKVRIKGKVDQSREKSSALPYTLV